MSRFVNEGKKRKFNLMVSIPENNIKMAEAAQENGADAIKIHINCHHRASGNNFGPWSEEKKNAVKIIESLKIPLGIVPGALEQVASPKEMQEIEELGFDFWDCFSHHTPLYMFERLKMGRMMAIDFQTSLEQIPMLEEIGMQVLETSVINPINYGAPLNVHDLAYYKRIVDSKKKAIVMVPTQKKIMPCELKYLKEAGVNGIVIGIIVTGNTVKSLGKATAQFRAAIDMLD